VPASCYVIFIFYFLGGAGAGTHASCTCATYRPTYYFLVHINLTQIVGMGMQLIGRALA
jgi:hypothetical protein